MANRPTESSNLPVPYDPGEPVYDVDDLVRGKAARRGAPVSSVPMLTAKELRDTFADYDAIRVMARKCELHVKFPFEPRLNQKMAKLGPRNSTRFDPKTKIWHVKFNVWPQLLDIAGEIQAAADEAWARQFATSFVLDQSDLQMSVPVRDVGNFVVGMKVRFEGQVFEVTHIGRPFKGPTEIMVHIYLVDPVTLLTHEPSLPIDPVNYSGPDADPVSAHHRDVTGQGDEAPLLLAQDIDDAGFDDPDDENDQTGGRPGAAVASDVIVVPPASSTRPRVATSPYDREVEGDDDPVHRGDATPSPTPDASAPEPPPDPASAGPAAVADTGGVPDDIEF